MSSSSRVFPACRHPRIGARAGLIQITAAGLLWGTTGVVVQLVRELTGLSAVSIGFYRLAIAAVVLVLLNARRLGPLAAALQSRPVPLILVGIGLSAYQASYFVAVTTAGVSVATVVSLGLAPVLIAAWEAARARRLPTLSTLGSLAAGVTGLVLITGSSTHPSAGAPRPLLGLFAAVVSGLGYAATTVLSRHVAQQVRPQDLTTVSTAVGALALAPFALLSGVELSGRPAAPALLVYLGVVTTAAAYRLFYAGLRTTSGSSAAVLTLLEPLTAAVLAVTVLSDPLPLMEVGGGVLLIGAVAALYLTPPAASRS